MNQPTKLPCLSRISAPNQTNRARQLINAALVETGIETLNESTARLIAACIHDGEGSSLYAFAATGVLEPVAMMVELRATKTTNSSGLWRGALMRFVELSGGKHNARSR
jgi:hypothetical protein